MRRLKITIQYFDGRIDVIEADHLKTESVQWRIETDEDILLIPMFGARNVLMQHQT